MVVVAQKSGTLKGLHLCAKMAHAARSGGWAYLRHRSTRTGLTQPRRARARPWSRWPSSRPWRSPASRRAAPAPATRSVQAPKPARDAYCGPSPHVRLAAEAPANGARAAKPRCGRSPTAGIAAACAPSAEPERHHHHLAQPPPPVQTAPHHRQRAEAAAVRPRPRASTPQQRTGVRRRGRADRRRVPRGGRVLRRASELRVQLHRQRRACSRRWGRCLDKARAAASPTGASCVDTNTTRDLQPRSRRRASTSRLRRTRARGPRWAACALRAARTRARAPGPANPPSDACVTLGRPPRSTPTGAMRLVRRASSARRRRPRASTSPAAPASSRVAARAR